jgi:oligopeptide/dipeptide ABC transporter ATP-binding protein
VPPPGRVTAGSVAVGGVGDLAKLSPGHWQRVRGAEIGMVFQGAQSMFSPLMTIERQFVDILRAHGRDVKEGMAEAGQLLRQARLDEARVLASYPHELSGGMRQRVAIVSSVMLHPRVLILDEPTTALDAVSQAKVLTMLRDLRRQYALSMLLITHDFAVASNVSDRLAVMYAGELVEVGPSAALYRSPRHPYTQGLVAAVPSLHGHRLDRSALLSGYPPDLRDLPAGCRFAPRCRFAEDICRAAPPALGATDEPERAVRCVRWRDVREAVYGHGT